MLLLSPILIKIQIKQKCKTFLEMIFMTDMKLRKLVLAALFAASAIYAPFDDNRDSGLPLTIVTIIALVALAVGFAMAARKVDPEARFKKKPKSVTKMKSKPVKAKDLMVDNYTSIDLETTGFSPSDDRIVEIGAIRVRNGRPVKRYSQLINPQRPLPEEITRLNGLTDADLRNLSLIHI